MVDKLWQEYQALRGWMSELMEIQRDNIASKTGERINRLTILSTIFLPITFMSGFYGMTLGCCIPVRTKSTLEIKYALFKTLVET